MLWGIVWISLMSLFSCQCQNLCWKSLAFSIGWRVVKAFGIWSSFIYMSYVNYKVCNGDIDLFFISWLVEGSGLQKSIFSTFPASITCTKNPKISQDDMQAMWVSNLSLLNCNPSRYLFCTFKDCTFVVIVAKNLLTFALLSRFFTFAKAESKQSSSCIFPPCNLWFWIGLS